MEKTLPQVNGHVSIKAYEEPAALTAPTSPVLEAAAGIFLFHSESAEHQCDPDAVCDKCSSSNTSPNQNWDSSGSLLAWLCAQG